MLSGQQIPPSSKMAAAAEGRAKLSFRNIFVQTQGAYKLRLALAQKLSHGKILKDDAEEIQELNILLEKSADTSLNVSLECSMALVGLVTENKIEFNYMLTKFLNILPSTSNKSGIIHAVTSLLLLQIDLLEHRHGVYKCPYGIGSHPHPFITILKNNPESGHLLIEKVGAVLNKTYGTQDTNQIFKMMKPFLLFILGDPRSST
ncbi:focadhesin-like, partial [Actinia tenebrosa]|uniref:Focadhesin-like n=1 Tax=Actinia tenebrosa TaxID=6105 RepID=A0A6P8HFU4_ACTTE